jgi:preprotein translocase subunit SecG
MAKIRNSSVDNAYGGGKQQIFTDDNGKEYVIKNSSLDNVYGGGKQKIVKERGSSGGIEDIIPWWVTVIIVVVCLIVQQTCF